MATALVGSPTSAGTSSRASQDRQFFADSSCSSGLQLRQPEPVVEALQATRDMCAYCFGECDVFRP